MEITATEPPAEKICFQIDKNVRQITNSPPLKTASAHPRIKTICPQKNQISSAILDHVTHPSAVHLPYGRSLVTVAPLVTEVFNQDLDVLNLQTILLKINVKKKNRHAMKTNVQNGLHGKLGLLVMVNVLMVTIYQREQDTAVGIKRMVAAKLVRTTLVVRHLVVTNNKKKNVILNHANLSAFGLNGVHGVVVLLTVPQVFK